MQVSEEHLPGSIVALTVSVETEMVEKQIEVAYRKNASKVTVPGFRPGKAPRALIAERLNPEMLMREAVDDLIETSFQQALKENELIPIEQAKLSDLKLEDDKSFSYKVTFTVEPGVTLGEYKGVEVSITSTRVTDEMIVEEIEEILTQSTKYEDITDSGVITGDYVTIDYTMKVNGEDYPEGNVEGYPVEIGTDTLFAELNEGLLGIKVGEIVTIKTTYADDYSDKELAGKEAEFAITITNVNRRVRPEMNDELAMQLSNGTVQNAEELQTRIREHLERQAKESDSESIRTELVTKIVDAAVLEIPDVMVDEEVDALMHELQHRLSHNRFTLDDYADYMKTTTEAIQEEQHEIAIKVVRRSLVLANIAKNENIFVSEQDIDIAIMMQLMQQGVASDEKSLRKEMRKVRKDLNKDGRIQEIAGNIRQQKIIGFLQKNAKITVDGVLQEQATENNDIDDINADINASMVKPTEALEAVETAATETE